jgi:hypothetical protein
VNRVVAKRDIGLMSFIIAVCVAVLVESWDLPPGTFEPLGSGPVPRAIAFVIIGLCSIILVRAFITLAKKPDEEQKTAEQINLEAEDKAAGFRPRPWSAVAVLLFSGLYIGILYLGIMGFGIVTVIFLFTIVVFLVGMGPVRAFGRLIITFDRTHLAAAGPVLIAAAIALIMGFGCEIVFTKIFYVDLPTG